MSTSVASSYQRTPTILILGMPDSIHTVRWINMVRGSWARIVLLPVYIVPPAPELLDWTTVRSASDLVSLPQGTVGVFDPMVIDRDEAWGADELHGHRRVSPMTMTVHMGLTTPHDVVRAIEILQPNLVHSLEI